MSTLPPDTNPDATPRREVVRRPKAAPAKAKAPMASTNPRSSDGRLEPLRSQMGRVPDEEIAQQAGVSRGVVGGFRRKYGIPAYDGYLFEKGQKPGVAKARSAPPVARKRGRTSRLEEFLHLLGVETDAVVAAKAGVSRAAVSSWRRKRGIEASQPKGNTLPKAAIPTTKPARAKGSRVEAYREQMGTMADKDLAALAGVTREVVGQYRREHGIPAWSGFRSKPRKTPTPHAEVIAASPRTLAYTVTATGNDVTRDYIAVGPNIEVACRTARIALEARGDGPWTIDGIRVLLEALS